MVIHKNCQGYSMDLSTIFCFNLDSEFNCNKRMQLKCVD